MKKQEKVFINLESLKSIKKGETRKTMLENKNYNLIQTISGFNKSILIYSKII